MDTPTKRVWSQHGSAQFNAVSPEGWSPEPDLQGRLQDTDISIHCFIYVSPFVIRSVGPESIQCGLEAEAERSESNRPTIPTRRRHDIHERVLGRARMLKLKLKAQGWLESDLAQEQSTEAYVHSQVTTQVEAPNQWKPNVTIHQPRPWSLTTRFNSPVARGPPSTIPSTDIASRST
ncbi:hypothetical protein EVG20_g8402 [Dentipellis fragilis]|uniref:Uncharacterized protein n=1 Tax=Dentipellis fragilis TaxID=205917 RepID=A0A4Y9Y899_9AGAM|nr:hypothetical protein EVG20_g8402 [Dentipellis fragilis]